MSKYPKSTTSSQNIYARSFDSLCRFFYVFFPPPLFPEKREAAELERLLDYIFKAPGERLPSAQIGSVSEEGLNSEHPRLYAEALLEHRLKPLCRKASLSGILRRCPHSGQEFLLRQQAELDFVLASDECGENGQLVSGSDLARFLRCYRLHCGDGGSGLNLRYAPGPGLYYYGFMTPVGKARFWAVPVKRFGIALMLTTGPSAHLGQLSLRARELGHSPLMPAGLYTGEHRLICESEEAIYEALNMDYVPPALR